MKIGKVLPLAALLLPLGMWGYAYELAYFATLKLNVHETLSLMHYVFTGASHIVPMLVILVLFSLLIKFFSKRIDKDDWEEVAKRMKQTNFVQTISQARLGFIISALFLVLVIIDLPLGEYSRLGLAFWWMIFFNIQLFIGSLLLSPIHSMAAVLVPFVLSVGFCFSAAGIDIARISLRSESTLRNDFVVEIKRVNNMLVATAKPIDIRLPSINRVTSYFSHK